MVNKYLPKTKLNPHVIIQREKALVAKHYSFIECSTIGNILYCNGSTQPTPHSATYKFRIAYSPPSAPVVIVREPIIIYNENIHMYPKNNSLCLYHKDDFLWNSNKHLFDTIIPWTIEWFIYYELYTITGKWEHPFVSHKTGEKIF